MENHRGSRNSFRRSPYFIPRAQTWRSGEEPVRRVTTKSDPLSIVPIECGFKSHRGMFFNQRRAMKVTVSDAKKAFNPIQVSFTIESEEEYRAIYAIFNYNPNCQLLPANLPYELRKQLEQHKIKEIGLDNVIARGVNYDSFYRSKQ